MSDEDALLAAIIANPDEDTPRLVYADWLDENGQEERAEFIRIQCRMARAIELDCSDDKRLGELEMEGHLENWLGTMPEFASGQWEFTRGMPERLSIRCDSFFAHYEQLKCISWLREVCLFDVMDWDVEELSRRDWNPRWDGLYIGEHPMSGIIVYQYDNTPTVLAIAGCPKTSQLKRLEFSLFGYASRAIEALISSPYLRQLQKLSLGCDLSGPEFGSLRERFGGRLTSEGLFV
ncbi:MAG: hypothetical protein C0467_18220 [Planctomycetaceae bacterium]|nr:hypothetical protein [Planctomycetaceae bacterium]